MSAPHATTIIKGYLRRLDDELSVLPRRRREEIVADIELHISEARGAPPDESDADLLNLLDRLGDPAAIAGEARERFGIDVATAGPRELFALLFLGVGNLIVPLVSWCVGALLVWRSRSWSENEKRFGAFIPLAGILGLLVLEWLPLGGERVPPSLALLIPVATTAYLAVRLGRRMPALAWLGGAVVTVIVALPVVVANLPVHLYAYVRYPEGSSATVRCGEFYATADHGGTLGATVRLNYSYCTDGSRVRTNWGPDCPVTSTGAVIISVTTCRATSQGGGVLTLDFAASSRPATSPIFGRQVSGSWLVRQDGTMIDLGQKLVPVVDAAPSSP